jgi:hypothetical protein
MHAAAGCFFVPCALLAAGMVLQHAIQPIKQAITAMMQPHSQRYVLSVWAVGQQLLISAKLL